MSSTLTYTLVDTNQTLFYGNSGEITAPEPGDSFYGQDASYSGVQPEYQANSDGTVSDLNTGLMWMQADSGSAMSWQDALAWAEGYEHGGYSDWRLPNAKELQSLVDYSRSPQTTASAAIDSLFEATNIGTRRSTWP